MALCGRFGVAKLGSRPIAYARDSILTSNQCLYFDNYGLKKNGKELAIHSDELKEERKGIFKLERFSNVDGIKQDRNEKDK